MAKSELSGTVVSFRQSKFKQDSYQTIVRLEGTEDPGKLIGARVTWLREDGFRIQGRVAARHGSSGAVRVRWNRGFPPQALGSPVKIRAGPTRARSASEEPPKEGAVAPPPLRKRARRAPPK